MNRPLRALTPEELAATSTKTLGHYQRLADEFFLGTQDHDVSQNIEALLRNIDGGGPYDILDFGCGPRTTLSMEYLPTHRFSMSQRRSSIVYCENSMTASGPAEYSSVRIREDPTLSVTMESDTAFSSKRQPGVPSFSTQVSPSWNITTGPQTNRESDSPGWQHCGENRQIRNPSPRP